MTRILLLILALIAAAWCAANVSASPVRSPEPAAASSCIAQPNPTIGYVDYCGYTYDQEAPYPAAAIVTRDGHMIEVAPGFAAGYDSVMWQENRYDCSNSNWITINGVAYEQLGCMQLLWDSAIRARAASFGFSRGDMLDESANLTVANSWFSDTEDWRRWATKPRWFAVKEEQ